MVQERLVAHEKESAWNSRLFKFGLVLAAAGAIFGVSEAVVVGVVAVGGAWALWKGRG